MKCELLALTLGLIPPARLWLLDKEMVQRKEAGVPIAAVFDCFYGNTEIKPFCVCLYLFSSAHHFSVMLMATTLLARALEGGIL